MRLAALVALALVGCAHGNPGNPDAEPPPDTPMGDAGCGPLPCAAIYVAPTGSDSAAGTKESPKKTIAAGIATAAAASPRQAVFAQAGSYAEALDVPSGVTIYGGFDASWNRSATGLTQITGASPAVAFRSINAPSGLDLVTVKSTDATQPGGSSIAVLVTASVMVELRNVTLLAGNGTNGSDGVNGTAGDGGSALDGGNGAKGVEHSTSTGCNNRTVPLGGGGGVSTCGRDGGFGGNPGVGSNAGAMGDTVGAAMGGAGGLSGKDGGVGADGASGAPGALGNAGAEAGMFMGGIYMPANGGNGAMGGLGGGGAGGGGGGGGTNLCDSSGSSGGGGGAGGCAGTPGTGGTGGGGSFGLVAIDARVSVVASTITAGIGGAGGAGGSGGSGGIGGAAGLGGPYGGSNDHDGGGAGGGGGGGGRGGAGWGGWWGAVGRGVLRRDDDGPRPAVDAERRDGWCRWGIVRQRRRGRVIDALDQLLVLLVGLLAGLLAGGRGARRTSRGGERSRAARRR